MNHQQIYQSYVHPAMMDSLEVMITLEDLHKGDFVVVMCKKRRLLSISL